MSLETSRRCGSSDSADYHDALDATPAAPAASVASARGWGNWFRDEKERQRLGSVYLLYIAVLYL